MKPPLPNNRDIFIVQEELLDLPDTVSFCLPPVIYYLKRRLSRNKTKPENDTESADSPDESEDADTIDPQPVTQMGPTSTVFTPHR